MLHAGLDMRKKKDVSTVLKCKEVNLFFKARFMYLRMCRQVLASKMREEQIFANSKNFIKFLTFMLGLKLKQTYY